MHIHHPFVHDCDDGTEHLELTSNHIFTLEFPIHSLGGSMMNVNDLFSWLSPKVCAKSADQFASKLAIPGFNGDLLIKYVLAYFQSALHYNGDVPLRHWIDGLKSEGIISVKPQQHLWYDAWNYTLKNGVRSWKIEYY